MGFVGTSVSDKDSAISTTEKVGETLGDDGPVVGVCVTLNEPNEGRLEVDDGEFTKMLLGMLLGELKVGTGFCKLIST